LHGREGDRAADAATPVARREAGAGQVAPPFCELRPAWLGRPVRAATPRARTAYAVAKECGTLAHGARAKEIGVKGSQKPKSAQKKPAQKTLKERRSAKKAAAKIRGVAE
jgi:hypothetical protein